MAEAARRYIPRAQLDIDQILLDAQQRWLRPPEICEILQNHQRFRIAPEPPTMPPSGSLFLFDRKVLRYFRRDGHNWRKKKDGKTVKEAHERLKSGSIDVLHCYYAHGEENENFQRRSYWMLEEDLSRIVLVHYRDVKGSRSYFNRASEIQKPVPYSQEANEIIPNEVDSSASCSNRQSDYHMHSQTTDTTSAKGVHASEHEEAQSAYNHHASSTFPAFRELQQPVAGSVNAGFSDHHSVSFSDYFQGKLSNKRRDNDDARLTYEPKKHIGCSSWENALGPADEKVPFHKLFSATNPDMMDIMPKQEQEKLQHIGSQLHVTEKWEASEDDYPDKKFNSNPAFDLTLRFDKQEDLKANTDINLAVSGKPISSFAMKQHLLDGALGEESLKKHDSFNRWMSKELGDVNDLGDVNETYKNSSSGLDWDTVETENGMNEGSIRSQKSLGAYMMNPSLSQDQLFSIIDFSPSWTFVGSEVKVLITGRFLKNRQEENKYKWSCMFGEVEVPAEAIAEGVLRCLAPKHEAGRVPFYVTCSNRLACSEVREFEYRVDQIQDLATAADICSGNAVEGLYMRFGKLMCSSVVCSKSDVSNASDVTQLRSKITSLFKENINDWEHMLKVTLGQEFSPEKIKDQLLEKLLKEKLHSWLLQKVAEGGKGANVLDQGGQGVLHFAAALGYDWALEPTIVAGVSVNFRDANGWTALHWAAFCGRERTVAALIALDAAPGALTDPTLKYPSSLTPADLASANGHKGIAGYLAESALCTHLSSLSFNSSVAAENIGVKEAQAVARTEDASSLKDSLAAVCKATQAAARIHQVFRVQSFQKKQLKEFDADKFGMSDDRALSLIAIKTNKTKQNDETVQAAAVRIQNKFRSWKGRREFLTMRKRIVKIQALVRGHQVRKNYKKIVWSVGIVEKIILRWRRKGAGLRGFKSEAATDTKGDASSKEEDDDFFKEGRKQTEERLQKALSRVKSMARDPESRDQYHRLLNVVNEIQETKVDNGLNSLEESTFLEDDLDESLVDDTSMPTAS